MEDMFTVINFVAISLKWKLDLVIYRLILDV